MQRHISSALALMQGGVACRKRTPEKPLLEDQETFEGLQASQEPAQPSADAHAAARGHGTPDAHDSTGVTVTRIYAGGICCPSEVPLITNILQPMQGVLKARAAPHACIA
jgi:hypothetical protein